MSPEETIEAAIKDAAELLGNRLPAAKGQDGSTVRKHNLLIDLFDLAAYPARLQELISEASHDAEVDATLCIFGAAFIDDAPENMPKSLRNFIASKLRDIGSTTRSGKKGKHSHINFHRDFVIAYAVACLVDRGFSPSRS